MTRRVQPAVETIQLAPDLPAEKHQNFSRFTIASVLFSLYLVFAWGSIYLSRQPGTIAIFWYANAIAVVLFQLRPARDWPMLMGAMAFANLLANLASSDSPRLSILFVLGNSCEVLLGAYLLRRFGQPDNSINHSGRLLKALALGGVGPALVGAILGASTLSAYGLAPFGKVWFSWFEGSVIGSLSVLPLGLAILTNGYRACVERVFHLEVLAAILFTLSVALLAPMKFLYPYVYIAVSLVLVANFGGFAATALSVLMVSITVGTLIAIGIFQQPPLPWQYSEALFYVPLMLTLIPPLMLAAALERLRQTMQQLAIKELFARSLYQKTPVMMHSADRSGCMVEVSETWLEKLGYTRDEVLGRQTLDFLTPESRHHVIDTVIPVFVRVGEVRDVEYQMVTKTGGVLTVRASSRWQRDENGHPVRTLSVAEDVTEEKRLSAELAAEQERIQVTLHSIGDGVVITDPHGCVSYLNPVAESMLGWTSAEAKGHQFATVVQLRDQSTGAVLLNPVEKCLKESKVYGLPENAMLRDRSGKEYGIQDSVAPILGRDGSILGTVMVFQDVTESRGLAQKMSYLAHHDGLTDLPNRVLLQDRIHQACQFGHRHHNRFAVLFMDLDHFKHVNDSLGHAIGDELLKTVARRLMATLRGSDTVCRLGGDEFVMLLSELTSIDDASDIAEKILREVAKPCVLNGTEINVSVSMGVSIFPEDGEDPDTLMKHADTAMYRAKREGRNRFHFFSKAVDEAASGRLILEADMRKGIPGGEFLVYYQPIVDSFSRKAVGVEALVRWDRKGHGLQSPGIFIPIAEECGLILPLGELVIRETCQQLQAWAGTELAHLRAAVNVSPLQLAQPGFPDLVSSILASTHVDAGQLTFEITESSLIKDPDAALSVISQIKKLGIQIALDDFGTGYSSLSYLKRFPFDIVKIDQSFVRDMESDASDRELIKAILAMSASLQLRVIAEGVETEGQANALKAMECPYLQGYLFAKPRNSSSTTDWLMENISTDLVNLA